MREDPLANPALLMVVSSIDDQTILRSVLDQFDLDLLFARSLEEARTALHERGFKAVISEGLLADGHCWKDLLGEIEEMPERPPLIVADPQADERLWVEVLNLGAWDLITKPFDAKEVLRVLSAACGVNEYERSIRRPGRLGSAMNARAARSGA